MLFRSGWAEGKLNRTEKENREDRERDQITDGLERKERERISDRCALLPRHAAVPFYGTLSTNNRAGKCK